MHGESEQSYGFYDPKQRNRTRLQTQARRLNVHFEARNRHEFRLELGLYPFIGNIEAKPDLFRELQPVLAQEAKLLERLRTLLRDTTALPAHIEANTKGLLAPGDTRSHTIVKFLGNLPTEPTIKQSALFFAEIIEVVTPLIEASLASEGGDEH